MKNIILIPLIGKLIAKTVTGFDSWTTDCSKKRHAYQITTTKSVKYSESFQSL